MERLDRSSTYTPAPVLTSGIWTKWNSIHPWQRINPEITVFRLSFGHHPHRLPHSHAHQRRCASVGAGYLQKSVAAQ